MSDSSDSPDTRTISSVLERRVVLQGIRRAEIPLGPNGFADPSSMLVVGEASTGREAIEVFRNKRPDVTLMDLQMPELNGIDAIVTIRHEQSQARVIILTTYEGDVLVRRALNAGATGYIWKV